MRNEPIGYTPDGVPLYPEDAFAWERSPGSIPESPSNIAGRAYAKATREYDASLKEAKRKMNEEVQGLDRRLSAVEGRVDMTGVPEVTEGSSIGEVKEAVGKMRGRLAGTAVCAALVLSLLAKTNEVHYAGVNELRDGRVVTNVVFGETAVTESDPVFSAWADSVTNAQGVVTNVAVGKVDATDLKDGDFRFTADGKVYVKVMRPEEYVVEIVSNTYTRSPERNVIGKMTEDPVPFYPFCDATYHIDIPSAYSRSRLVHFPDEYSSPTAWEFSISSSGFGSIGKGPGVPKPGFDGYLMFDRRSSSVNPGYIVIHAYHKPPEVEYDWVETNVYDRIVEGSSERDAFSRAVTSVVGGDAAQLPDVSYGESAKLVAATNGLITVSYSFSSSGSQFHIDLPPGAFIWSPAGPSGVRVGGREEIVNGTNTHNVVDYDVLGSYMYATNRQTGGWSVVRPAVDAAGNIVFEVGD